MYMLYNVLSPIAISIDADTFANAAKVLQLCKTLI